MAQIIAHRADSASAPVANEFNWLRIVPDAFAHTVEGLAIGKDD